GGVRECVEGFWGVGGGGGGKRSSRHGRCRSHATLHETASIRLLHVRAPQKINFAPSWIWRWFGYVVLVALMRPKFAEPNTAFGLPKLTLLNALKISARIWTRTDL